MSLDDDIKLLDEQIIDADEHTARWQLLAQSLRDQRSRLVRRRQHLESTTGEQRGADKGMEYIKVEHVIPHIHNWISNYNSVNRLGGQLALAQAARISPKTLQRVMNGNRQYVGWDTADRLMAAMGLEHLIEDLPIVSPEWVNRRRPFNHYYEE